MTEFKFDIGGMVALRGMAVIGVVAERFVNADTHRVYYTILFGFNGSSPLIDERMLESLEEAKVRQAEAQRQDDLEFYARKAARRGADA